jgi:hypothetical protein
MTTHQVRSYVPSVSTDDPTPTRQHEAPRTEQNLAPEYEIRVGGHLSSRWSAWFDGLTIDRAEAGVTVIRGPVVDQAALHGLIQKLRDVGIPLISLAQLPSNPTPEPPAHHTQGEQP